MHELLRQYGMEQLEAYGETEATYARHSQYFAQLMLRHEAALQQPQQLETMQAIERDFDNIRLAWEWSATESARDAPPRDAQRAVSVWVFTQPLP